jgi:hypothetical protein
MAISRTERGAVSSTQYQLQKHMAKTKLKIGDHFFDGDKYGLVISSKKAVFIEANLDDYDVSVGQLPKSYEVNVMLCKPVYLAFKALRKVLDI